MSIQGCCSPVAGAAGELAFVAFAALAAGGAGVVELAKFTVFGAGPTDGGLRVDEPAGGKLNGGELLTATGDVLFPDADMVGAAIVGISAD